RSLASCVPGPLISASWYWLRMCSGMGGALERQGRIVGAARKNRWSGEGRIVGVAEKERWSGVEKSLE
ncbi:hypothetical protein RO787_04695, partial [Blautia coccoides]|uniref:hypothetical protein n=1 Tax=Blautia producta TaxID=33035 RepID=UPI0028A4338C